MIPTMIKIHIDKKQGKGFKIIFPIIFVWLFIFLVVLIFAPLMIIIAFLAWPMGYGKMILMFPVLLFSTIAGLSEMLVDVRNKNENVFVSFY